MRFLCFLLIAVSCAFATQATTPNGSGFANTCAGVGFSGIPNPGDGYPATVSNTCSTQIAAFASATASDAGVSNGQAYSNSASAQAGPGFIKTFATNSGVQASQFPGASSYAGWNDRITLNHTFAGGGSAVWIVPLLLKGTLQVTGTGGLARIGMAPYHNHNQLTTGFSTLHAYAYNQFLALNGGSSGIRNSVIGFNFTYQAVWFGADDSLPNYSVDRTVYFAFPFTYGQAFDFGFYLGGVVGERSSGGFTTPNTAGFDFAHSAYWGGRGQVVDENGVYNDNFNITASSGFDYNSAVVPEPSSFGLLALGAGAVALLKRRSALG